MSLRIKDLNVTINEKKILKDLSLEVKPGQIHAIMGPNGSGKSTLSYAIAGHPKYKVEGKIEFNDKDLLKLSPAERSKEGIFLAFQHPLEIQGLSFSHFMYSSMKARNKDLTPMEFNKILKENTAFLEKDQAFTSRQVNVGFSGGEKKRAELLQLLMLNPKLAILDETDSGLDLDALRLIAKTVNKLKSDNFSAVIITHYPKLLELIKPDQVHVLADGKIVLSGKAELVNKIEKEGYAWVKEK